MRRPEEYRPEGVKPIHREDTRSEDEIQAGVVNTFEALGFKVWSLSQPRATMQTEGLADLFVTGRGVCCWVEVKSATGRQSDHQRGFEASVVANGGLYIVVRHEQDAVAWAEGIGVLRSA